MHEVERIEPLTLRLKQLERRIRIRDRLFAVALLVTVVSLSVGSQARDPRPSLEASRFILREPGEISRGELGIEENGTVGLFLSDSTGRRRLMTRVSASGMSLISLLNQSGSPLIELGWNETQGCGLAVRDTTLNHRIELAASKDGQAGLIITSRDERGADEPRTTLGLSNNDVTGLDLRVKGKEKQIRISAGRNGLEGPWISMWENDQLKSTIPAIKK